MFQAIKIPLVQSVQVYINLQGERDHKECSNSPEFVLSKLERKRKFKSEL